MRKTKVPVLELIQDDKKLYVVTDKISGNINGKLISGIRGDMMYLSADAAKLFKDRILEVHNGIRC